ncbi:Holliday junction resolvase RecU [Mammaliicoccus sciuri]|uniref:Holliday junction resolvase RecU n=1 Tax=Mammaliicoccus sciuri TaxID=1296 RepID=UPI003A8DEABB
MTNYSNRGKWLESVIESSNKQYYERGLAIINKIPTPMAKRRATGQYFYSEKSTVDFIGISFGKYIAFDTKETSTDTFPFSNVKHHQLKYLDDVAYHGGKAFLIILFKKHNELYKLSISEYKHLMNTLERKSIPYKWFKENKTPIHSKLGVYYDYLDIAHKGVGGI